MFGGERIKQSKTEKKKLFCSQLTFKSTTRQRTIQTRVDLRSINENSERVKFSARTWNRKKKTKQKIDCSMSLSSDDVTKRRNGGKTEVGCLCKGYFEPRGDMWFIHRERSPKWKNHISTRCLKITSLFFTWARYQPWHVFVRCFDTRTLTKQTNKQTNK